MAETQQDKPPAAAPAPGPMGLLERASATLHVTFANAFGWLATMVVEGPWWTVLITIIVAIICAQGIWFYSEELSAEKQFTPSDSVAFKNDDWVKANFGAEEQPMQAYFLSTGNILTKPALLYMLQYHDFLITEVSGDYKGTSYDYNYTCARYSPSDPCKAATGILRFWDFNITELQMDTDPLATINTPGLWEQVSPSGGYFTSFLKGVEYGPTGSVVSATGAQMWMYNRYEKRKIAGDGDKHPEVDAYEVAAFEATEERRDDGASVGVTVYLRTEGFFSQESGNAIRGDVSALIIGYVLLIVFTSCVLARNRVRYSHVALAFITVLSVGLATLSAYGMCWYIGIPFNSVVQVLVLVLLGLGVDDAFVIMYSWWDAADEPDIKQRMITAIRHAGPAIMLTSVTDLVAFLAGSSTRLPALRDFCIYATFGIIFDFAYQCTFFVACAFLASRRQEASRMDCCCCFEVTDDSGCCVDTSQKVGVDWKESDPGTFRNIFGVYVPRGVLSKPGKVLVTLLALVFIGVGIYGCTELKMDFNYEWFTPADSPLQEVYDARDEFVSKYIPSTIYAGALDYPNEQEKLMDDLAVARGSKWVVSGSLSVWLTEFQQWVRANHPQHSSRVTRNDEDYDLVAPSEFYRLLRLFASTEDGPPSSWQHIDNLRWDPTYSSLTATKYPFLLPAEPARDGMTAYDVTQHFQSLLRGTSLFAHAPFWVFWEGYGIIMDEMLRNVIIAGACVFVLVLIITANVALSFAIVINVALIDVCLLGWMDIIGVAINSVSVICVVLAVGLVVDYSVHIAGEFVQVKGQDVDGLDQRTMRAAYSIAKMGPAVGAGGFSTLLAVLPLAVAKSYVFTVFFRMFVLIIGFGLFFGVCVLPVVFSVIGPAPNSTAVPLDDVPNLMPLHNYCLLPTEPVVERKPVQHTLGKPPQPTFNQ